MTLARTKIRVRRLRRSELPVDTVELARFLIGKTLVHDLPHVRLSGRIVETEAYLVGDAASHAFRGVTPRNRALFLERGHAYVYFIYGNHFMLNVSGQREGIGEGILLRGLEPLEGIDWMQLHRAEKPSTRRRSNRSAEKARKKSTAPLTELSRGPGRLAAALRITRSLDGVDLCAKGPLWLGTAAKPTGEIGVSVRIGIRVEAHRLLRFYERGNPFVSGPHRLNS
ncbi:MAG TPA: DNA-3-methyladenine glycosylase [Candidatus Binatus sp.]|jgi:DNA-3-methyladenine glycosylase|nr:DNA-3-methyladenine glycosylase [Candidatus Binatus sp.]